MIPDRREAQADCVECRRGEAYPMASLPTFSPHDPGQRVTYARPPYRHPKALRVLTLSLLAFLVFLGSKMHNTLDMAHRLGAADSLLFDGNAGMHGIVSVAVEGGPALQLLDDDGNPRLLASLSPDGTPSFFLLDDHRYARSDGYLDQYGQVSLSLLEQMGPTYTPLDVEVAGFRSFLRQDTRSPRLTLGIASGDTLGRLLTDYTDHMLWRPPAP